MLAERKKDRNLQFLFQLQDLARSFCLCTDCQPVFNLLRLILHFLHAAEASVLRKHAEASAVFGKNRGVVGPQTSDAQLLVVLNTWQTCTCKGSIGFSHYGAMVVPDQDQEDFKVNSLLQNNIVQYFRRPGCASTLYTFLLNFWFGISC